MRLANRATIITAALFLASEESGSVAGYVLNVDGGCHAAGLMFDRAPEAGE
jgi:enoyl-[acyl-carrier-protein] reductase (NADH)